MEPNNSKAERAVLGACLLSAQAMNDVAEILTPEDFYDSNNKIAYRICIDLYADDKPVDFITFQSEAVNRNVFDRLGGQPYLAELVSDVTVEANVKQHVQIVKDLSKRRRILNAAKTITSWAWKTDMDVSDVMEEVNKSVLELSEEKKSAPVPVEDTLQSVRIVIKETYEGLRENRGFFSGFRECRQDIRSHINIAHICTEATYEVAFLK